MLGADTPWRITFPLINTSRKIADLWQIQKYNPHITLLPDDNPNIFHGSGPTLFLHGLFGGKNPSMTYRRCTNSKSMPGDIITFDFPDASQWIHQTVPYKISIKR